MTKIYDPTDVKPRYEVPTYNSSTKQWGYTYFYTIEEFRDLVKSCFKEPGKYEFDEVSSSIFNEQAQLFRKNKVYCFSPFNSKDFKVYWDTQKERCRRGAIIINGNKTWYLSRDYYMWLNFLPITNKEKQDILGSDDTESFADIRDAQYHIALYETLSELHYVHAVGLKKRQIASSFYHAAKLINQIWFEKGVTCKMGASDWDFIGEEGTWKMLNQYRSFLNEYTAWYRPFKPEGVGMWTQKIEVTINGRKSDKGLNSNLMGLTLDKSPTKGVGGAVKYFFYEEGGIAPTADKTYEFIRPALSSGMITVGMFILFGSVGDLKQCVPLKKFMLDPEPNGFYGVETDLYDDKGTIKVCGLFIPEQWSMLPYIDKHGNSLVEESLAAIIKERQQWRDGGLSPDQYQLRISQKPINIKEAFAYREESPFPIHLIQAQIRRIEEHEYPAEYVELFKDDDRKVKTKPTKKLPLTDFPVKKGAQDKEGVVVIYERPDINLTPLVTYYASIDPIHTGKTTTSRSLCSIIIYKNAVEVKRENDDGKTEYHVEGDKIVAEWCGRMDDIEKVHERLEMLIEYYQAWTFIEFNGSFVTYMTAKHKTHYLVPSNQVSFNKEVTPGYSPNHPYGWKNVGTVFKTHILPYGIEYLTEELDADDLPNGDRIVTKRGIQRIPSKMILEEMLQYTGEGNYDRLISYCALAALVKIQRANRGVERRQERKRDLEKSKDLYKFKVSPFSNLGKAGVSGVAGLRKKTAFKNLR